MKRCSRCGEFYEDAHECRDVVAASKTASVAAGRSEPRKRDGRHTGAGEQILSSEQPAPTVLVPKGKYDRNVAHRNYMRDYMRKRRAAKAVQR